jgi:hypothetical protein
MRSIGAFVLGIAVVAGGLVLLAAAGVVVLILTEPTNQLFLPVFVAPAAGVVMLANRLMGRIVTGLHPDHPARLGWIRAGRGLATFVLLLGGFGIYRLATTPIHWQ